MVDRATYVAASGGLRQLRRLDVTSNNIANVNTVGFKQQMVVSSEQRFEETFASELDKSNPYARADHDRTPGTTDIQTVTDYSPGSFITTGRDLDAALPNPKDFFVIQTPQGQQYTRAGNFSLSEDGTLVTPDGYQVQGDGGPITITGGRGMIAPGGSVLSDDQIVGRLQVVRIEEPLYLERMAASRFRPVSPLAQAAPVDEPEVLSQAVETSNVSAVQGMIDLVATNRAFEAYTKAAKTIDEINNAAVTQVGRRR
jgi:flagellar basal-body rod protein FlgF